MLLRFELIPDVPEDTCVRQFDLESVALLGHQAGFAHNPSILNLELKFLVGVKHFRPQQIEVCPPIHRSFDGFQMIDLSFNLPVTPLSFDCRLVRR